MHFDPQDARRKRNRPTNNISEVWEGDRLEGLVVALVFVFNCRGSCSKKAEGGPPWAACSLSNAAISTNENARRKVERMGMINKTREKSKQIR